MKIAGKIRPRIYPLIVETVETGIDYALGRAWKYREAPKGWTDEIEADLAASISESVVREFCERFTWDDETELQTAGESKFQAAGEFTIGEFANFRCFPCKECGSPITIHRECCSLYRDPETL